MDRKNWSFFIDVGGTFTDVVARRPDGLLLTHKLLSTGAVRGVVEDGTTSRCIFDGQRRIDPPDFWTGYELIVFGVDGSPAFSCRVARFDAAQGALFLSQPIDPVPARGFAYELRGPESAPVLAVRYLMGLRLCDPIGAVDVRLGTTRATNALLERKGARVAFVTTKGFADVLRIGYQDRPDLFSLHVGKREELTERVVEIDERMAADGAVLRSPRSEQVRAALQEARSAGVDAAAICLLHAPANPAHEELVSQIAEEVGFVHVSVSSRAARMEKIVPRGDTTVLDAYLTPVIRDYVAALRQAMPDARLKLMTSQGGLIDAAAVSGKDTLLSGPAGGVVGCADVALRAGFEKTIGFDMGGTSTDVCRIEPPPDRFEYRLEAVKTGVRFMTPMLAVETVAAGGGSICSFDGQRLKVGPQSAGADPGPACYGRGGPLTLTDANLALGRIVPERFPFALDRNVVARKLSKLAGEIRSATGAELSILQIAEGFVRIANLRMASAIKKISLARGYDPRDYALTTFGGAGAQHACAIAAMLGIRRVLCHPLAGVLSAWGISVAPHKRMAQRSVNLDLDEHAAPALFPILRSITAELKRALVEDGVDAESLAGPVCTLELCYSGQATTIAVSHASPGRFVLRDLLLGDRPSSRPADHQPSTSAADQESPLLFQQDSVREQFENLHRQLYGYVHHDRRVTIRAVRVELGTRDAGSAGGEQVADAPSRGARSARTSSGTARNAADPGNVTDCSTGVRNESQHSHDRATKLAPPKCSTTLFVDGHTHTAPVYVRADLSPGARVDGPAIVTERTSTIVIDPGWRAEALDTGGLLLTAVSVPAAQEQVSTDVDPIQLELFNHQFAAVAEQMGTTLRRTALSTNVKERLDFSCAVFTPEGDLVANAPHIPVHLGAMSDCVKALMQDVGEFAPGDVYVTNDPYRGGSHLNDVTVVTPVLDTGPQSSGSGNNDAGPRILFFVASRAHHAEIGGTRPGSMPPDATRLTEEGVLIRATPWIKNGRPQHERLRALLTAGPYPSRTPDENLADLAAQAAANQAGARELKRMIGRYSLDVVHAYMRHIQLAAQRKMRAALALLPDGVFPFEDRMDDGTPIRLTLTIDGDQAVLDFTGSGPVHPGNLNANRSIVSSAVIYCFRCLIDEDIPLNAGVLAPIRIVLPECFLNPPLRADAADCPAVVGGNVETSQRIVDCIFGALSTVAASQGTMNNVLIGNERFGYYETICGGAGAGSGFHGADAVHTHMTNTRMTDPEILESRVPVRVIRFEIRRGSGGAGRFRGGCGVIRELEFLEPLQVSILSQRRTSVPYGLAGGGPGAPGENLLQPAEDGRVEVLPPIAHRTVLPGDRLTIATPGGGAFGPAEESDGGRWGNVTR